ncbi:hypothetical protein NX059_008239 [Plenodomus lindquistii]|nr:hypothetical protein NX059_008239 [Plenodomus lindquistii]
MCVATVARASADTWALEGPLGFCTQSPGLAQSVLLPVSTRIGRAAARCSPRRRDDIIIRETPAPCARRLASWAGPSRLVAIARPVHRDVWPSASLATRFTACRLRRPSSRLRLEHTPTHTTHTMRSPSR